MAIQTMHELKQSRKWGVVPACQAFSLRRPQSFSGTQDRAAVSCKRCAKLGGYAPAAKPESQNPTGTCQCCFGAQKVVKGRIALHGYTRPGWGHINGRCRGSGFVPFEVSCEQTQAYQRELQTFLFDREAYLAKLATNDVQEGLVHEVRRRVAGSWEYTTAYVTVAKGAASHGIRNTPSYIPSFEEVRASEMAATCLRIEALKAHIRLLDGRIADWKPVPFPPR